MRVRSTLSTASMSETAIPGSVEIRSRYTVA
jgi:hypothetical protein